MVLRTTAGETDGLAGAVGPLDDAPDSPAPRIGNVVACRLAAEGTPAAAPAPDAPDADDHRVADSASHLCITTEVERAAVPFGDEASLLVLCSIQAPQLLGDGRASRAPLTVCAVLDCSSSMGDHCKLELLKQTMLFVVNQLKAGDRLGIVVFHTKVKQLLPLTEMTPCGKHRAQVAIGAMRADGRTNLSGGLL